MKTKHLARSNEILFNVKLSLVSYTFPRKYHVQDIIIFDANNEAL